MKAIVVFDIDGVIRDVSHSYRRALADTVERFTEGQYRPAMEAIDTLKAEGRWNNDWEASQELIYRYFEQQGQPRSQLELDYGAVVAFFQSRYRGPNPDDPDQWTGYICDEPLLLAATYLEALSQGQIAWGFFSGATRGSARYVLERRLGLQDPVLVAMEDAPGKPDPTGLFQVIEQLEQDYGLAPALPVVYAGDTVADLQTVQAAQQQRPDRTWLGVGVLPPHVQVSSERQASYAEVLMGAGAVTVVANIQDLTPGQVHALVSESGSAAR